MPGLPKQVDSHCGPVVSGQGFFGFVGPPHAKKNCVELAAAWLRDSASHLVSTCEVWC